MFGDYRGPRRAFLRNVIGATCCIGAMVLAGVAQARPPIACGALHSVERGDTLFRIAERAYGDGRNYRRIYVANKDLLPNEQSVEIGDQILIPCLDGTGPASRKEALAQATATDTLAFDESKSATGDSAAAEQPDPFDAFRRRTGLLVLSSSAGGDAIVTPGINAPNPADGPVNRSLLDGSLLDGGFVPAQTAAPEPPAGDLPVRLLTGNGLVPYAGENLMKGGMATEIVARAIQLAVPARAQEIVYLDHWESQLDQLRSGALDVGFPWGKPDCQVRNDLTPQAQLLCSDFAFSRPFLSLPIAIYVRADVPFTGLAGRTVCRAQAAYPFDMYGGIPTAAGMIREESAIFCFARLLRGEVDAVQLPRPEAEKAVRLARIDGHVREIEELATTRTLHAIAPKSSRTGLAYLAMIDAGLDKLMLTGEWFDIVAAHQSHQLALAE